MIPGAKHSMPDMPYPNYSQVSNEGTRDTFNFPSSSIKSTDMYPTLLLQMFAS